jgi:2'-5' RNA ligase
VITVRLFVAVNLPPPVRQAMWQSAAPLRSRGFPFRWVGPDALHLTLKFLGEVDARREPEVIRAVENATEGTKEFLLTIGGFGAFPNGRRPRVVWIGCGAVPALELVHHRLERQMDEIGFPLEGRAFRPHITMGRVSKGARPRELEGIESLLEQLDYQSEAAAHSVDLMESELRPAGARYTVRHAVPLGV